MFSAEHQLVFDRWKRPARRDACPESGIGRRWEADSSAFVLRPSPATQIHPHTYLTSHFALSANAVALLFQSSLRCTATLAGVSRQSPLFPTNRRHGQTLAYRKLSLALTKETISRCPQAPLTPAAMSPCFCESWCGCHSAQTKQMNMFWKDFLLPSKMTWC